MRETPRGKRERIFRHYLAVLQLCLDQFDTPEGVHEFIVDLFALLGFDATEEFISVYDDRIAEANCPTLSKREAKKQRLRRQRKKLFTWQSDSDSDGLRYPELIEWREINDPTSHQTHYEYRMPIAALVREIVEGCPVGTRTAKLQPAVVRACGRFVASQRAKKRPLRRKREVSAESDFNRAETLAKNGFEKMAKLENSVSARARLKAMCLRLLALAEGGCDHFDHTPPAENLTFGEVESAEEFAAFFEDAFSINSVREFEDSPPDLSQFELDGSEPAFDDPPTMEAIPETKPAKPASHCGQPKDAFINHAATIQRETWQRERSERIANYFSLVEIERFDPRAGGRSKTERDFYCPTCDPGKKHNRSLSVNAITGAYICHRCHVEGCLRERCEETTSNGLPARFYLVPAASPKVTTLTPAEPSTEQLARIDQARRKYDKAPKASAVQVAADYLKGRGVPIDAADRCGVRYAFHQGRKAVIFPFINQAGEIVAINDRRVDGDKDKARTTGPKSHGVFVTPGALDAARVVVVESPLDAVAWYAVGVEAIATGGTSWPDWLAAALEGVEVLPGFDNDPPNERGERPGDIAATKFARDLIGRAALIRRLKPSLKDWLEIVETRGLDSLREELAVAIREDVIEDADSQIVEEVF